ncbi:hypothetical protein IFM89_015957 [Coptis chinensis]|uniref:Uncharacterized protein n=1 Tax=Coptis chinensis TaxID=261450 RepID=A0A835LIS2_9MAGN|nr:hypothetical protein IFM89_015957 [Coptis chinensis]
MGKAVALSTAEELSTAGAKVFAAGVKEKLSTAEGNTASRGAAESVNEQITSVNLSLEGDSEKPTLDGVKENSYNEGAKVLTAIAKTKNGYDQVGGRTEKSVVKNVLGPQATGEVADAAWSEIEASLEELGVARGKENLADNGAKVSVAAAPLFSKVAGMPTSLLQKETPSILAPTFRSNLEEAVGLQVVNTPPAKARIRQSKYFIEEIKTAEGTILHDQGLIKEYMVQAYKVKFEAISVLRNQELLNLIPHAVTEQQNDMLIAIPSGREITDTVMGMDPQSSLGPDGF